MTHLRMLSVSMCAASALLAGFAWFARGGRKKKDFEQERRTRLSRTGRLTVGTAMDVQESVDEDEHPVQLLIYQYDVAGVQYEASQDLTNLEEYVDVHSCRLGAPATVRYDPQNPGNSIVVSETWSGLRK